MKQRLETVSAVLVLLVIGLAWVNEREDGPQPSAVIGEAARSGAGLATVPVEARSPMQQEEVTCTKERDSKPRRVSASGGKIKEDFAQVHYGPGAFVDDTKVQIIPDPTHHGITLRPTPATAVVVLLRLGYCDEEVAGPYWLNTQADTIPADREETSHLVFLKRHWAAAEIQPSAFKPIPPPPDPTGVRPLIRPGFVVLSN